MRGKSKDRILFQDKRVQKMRADNREKSMLARWGKTGMLMGEMDGFRKIPN